MVLAISVPCSVFHVVRRRYVQVQYHVFGELAYDDPCSDCEKG